MAIFGTRRVKEEKMATDRERLASLEAKIDLVLENHLPHLDAKVENLQKSVWTATGALIGIQVLVGLVLSLWDKL